MCEFKVYLDGEKVMDDVIYAEVDMDVVTVRDVIGEMMVFENTRIVEVNVPSTRLILKGI